MPAFMWTINDLETMEAALAAGVDGIITDRPDVARGLLGRLGISLQE
jgi:glycerophosphoryl diester phosphodiesterase